MKRIKTMLGVTLLEVMLVLAIASMIIVMSIRYYQSASAAQQVNSVLNQIQGIVASADSLSQTTGSYANLTAATLAPLLPAGSTTTPWGTDMLGALAASASTYVIDLGGVPSGVCPLLISKLGANNHFKPSTTTCGATATAIKITYISNP